MAKKLGFADKMFKNIKVENDLPVAEDILREINRGSWSTGYCGQSPERIKAHMKNQTRFDMVTHAGDEGRSGSRRRLLRPALAVLGQRRKSSIPARRSSTTPISHVMDGGGTFRPRFGVEREEKLADGTTRKVSLLAEGSYSLGSEIKDGYPEFTMASAEEARLGQGSHRGGDGP